ncbi:protein PAXX isoform X1 [Candoia aspera]|uniref:protein PAXX isoform X1 n=1 Tax=Candoia aspera TaxID=51853 RepID=UPI002FD7A118
MAPPGPLRVVSHGGRRFLCFCEGGGDSPRLQLTDACEFWSCRIPSEKLDGQKEPCSPADCLFRLRKLVQGQPPALTLHDGGATLRVQDGGQSVTFDLCKAPPSEARRQLQDLTFGLVEQLQTLEKRLEESAATSMALGSPEKKSSPSQSLLEAGLKNQILETQLYLCLILPRGKDFLQGETVPGPAVCECLLQTAGKTEAHRSPGEGPVRVRGGCRGSPSLIPDSEARRSRRG